MSFLSGLSHSACILVIAPDSEEVHRGWYVCPNCGGAPSGEPGDPFSCIFCRNEGVIAAVQYDRFLRLREQLRRPDVSSAD
jgi:hypothetical protein